MYSSQYPHGWAWCCSSPIPLVPHADSHSGPAVVSLFPVLGSLARSYLVLLGKPESNITLGWWHHASDMAQLHAFMPASPWLWVLRALLGSGGEPRLAPPRGPCVKHMRVVCSDSLLYPWATSYCNLELGFSISSLVPKQSEPNLLWNKRNKKVLHQAHLCCHLGVSH